MEKIEIYFKSDFTVILASEAQWGGCPFRLSFYTASPSRSFVACYDGENYHNCRLLDDGRLEIAINQKNGNVQTLMGIGTLTVAPEFYLDNDAFRDHVCNQFVKPFVPTFEDENRNEYQVNLSLNGVSTLVTYGTLPAFYKSGISEEERQAILEETAAAHEAAELARAKANKATDAASDANMAANKANDAAEYAEKEGDKAQEAADDIQRAEDRRVIAENKRVTAENARQQAEDYRQASYDVHNKNEGRRQQMEQQRGIAEEGRVEAENARQQAEAARQHAFYEAEAARQMMFDNKEAQRDAAVAEATKVADEVATFNETVEGIRKDQVNEKQFEEIVKKLPDGQAVSAEVAALSLKVGELDSAVEQGVTAASNRALAAQASAESAAASATKAETEATKAANTLVELKQEMQNLPDGSAVSAQVAVNTVKLSELDKKVKSLTAEGGNIVISVGELEDVGGIINSVNNKWYTTNPADYAHSIIEVEPNTECKLKTGSTRGAYALLRSYSPINGTLVDYCDGETLKSLSAKVTHLFVIPSDCHYIYIQRMSSGRRESIETVSLLSEQGTIPAIISRCDGLDERVGKLENKSEGSDCYLVAKEIKENRPYFLNDSFENELSYADTSYLDEKIRNVPEGKHFIFSTDSHINYKDARRTQRAVGLTQRETEIMLYVKKKLNITPVVFGGDIIGTAESSYQGAKIVSVFCEDKFNAFGKDFIFCMGNHDCNHVKGLAQDKWVSDEEIYKRTTGVMARYGIAQFDEEGIEAVDNIGLSASDASDLKAWMKLHYLWDDDRNKVRYIVLESGDYGYAASVVLGVGGAGSYLIWTYMDWVVSAFDTCPDNYDIVVVEHEIGAITDFTNGVYTPKWKGSVVLYDIISKFNRRLAFSSDSQNMASFPNIDKMRLFRNQSGLYTADFSKRTSGKAFIISGHFHSDDAWLIQKSSSEGLSSYSGVEYATNPMRKDDSVLAIQVDRSMINAKGVSFSTVAPHATTFEDDQTIPRWETPNEVLFDIVTITNDGRVVCTRVGGGNDREFVL